MPAAARVASRPRFGCYSQARTLQLGRTQLDRHSWTGTSYSHETGSRPTGFSYVYKYLLVPSRIDSNKQCFHNQYMHTCLLRATRSDKGLLGSSHVMEGMYGGHAVGLFRVLTCSCNGTGAIQTQKPREC